ncbi:MarR family transcriptional regulator [Kordiimonas sediminis]|uniref:MarR family transcriptional regulator n=1 Tax=Kordiimonas sediminis TaxID=1735581 RepID=A0A919ALE1_9PROT|nr:MarR family transcriptional regulator [Kordiimonas sediminis]GHF13504.1 MarR family transcriptional regulator [Kordiimonas sediminis]
MADNPLITSEREREALRMWLELTRATKSLEASISARLKKDFGQSFTRFDVCSQLYRAVSKTLSVTDLAKRLLASSSHNITGLLGRMEKDGLVSRQRNPDDKRSMFISLTPDGIQLFEAMAKEHGNWVQESFNNLGTDEMRSVRSALQQMRIKLDTT